MWTKAVCLLSRVWPPVARRHRRHANQGCMTYQLEYARHGRRRRRRHWAHAPTIHATSNVDRKKRVAWFSISIVPFGSVPIFFLFLWAAENCAIKDVKFFTTRRTSTTHPGFFLGRALFKHDNELIIWLLNSVLPSYTSPERGCWVLWLESIPVS